MEFVELGHTGARVSVVGLGCGGHSRLGMTYGNDIGAAANVVRAALDLGITFIDTAEAYGTEEAVGEGIKGNREAVFVSTKTSPAARDGQPLGASGLANKIDASLKRLKTDYIDLFNLHGVTDSLYDHGTEVLLPELKRQQAKGKIRFLGITEAFERERSHAMLQRALLHPCFDVVMVGFSILNPSARKTVFPLTRKHGVGTLIMFAVRRALSQPEALRDLLRSLETERFVPEGTTADALDFVTRDSGVRSLVEAAYRFCRHEPGADVVLTGTGKPDHLKKNVAAILAPPLSTPIQDRLWEIFGNVATVSGN